LVVCAWLANRTPRPWHVRYLPKPICQEGRLPGLGDKAEYVNLLRRAGFAVSNVEDISTAVARTWSACVRRALRGLATDSRYRPFVLRGNARDRIWHQFVPDASGLPHRRDVLRRTDRHKGQRLNGRPAPAFAN
jgi:tocopherol O-methyltransferase